ncbi:hypothetical protein ACH5RR_036667 [Cinchona calisaya]|uniref:Uncharacterized protein n=1 Tax=Cinchona calisaya TaxID=153742 RepID=A0ABD2Y9B3_9GENT
MATESNSGFHHHRPQAMSFQSGAASAGNYFNRHHHHAHLGINVAAVAGGSMVYSGTPGVIFSSNCSNNSAISQARNSLGLGSESLLLDNVPGLKLDAGFAVEWSVEEQYKLEEGLAKYADEPSIMKYIKIAAILRDKTVRDVALRCRWMMRKRRKQEDHNLGKKVKDRRERIESCMTNQISSASPMNMVAYSIPLQPCDQSDSTSTGVSALISTTRHLLEENRRALGQISANLTTLKLQDNVDLFLRTRSNLTSILDDMKNMPGIMSQMPPLPVFINEELARSILPSSTQCMMFGSSSGLHLKQEPGC